MPKAQHPKAALFARQNLFAGIASFAELEARIASLPDEQSRGGAFEVFAEAYLATQRKHDAAMVWPLPSVPTGILQTLGLVVQDQGVDGVFETLLGNYNAYQVKFRTNRPALTWRELSTFMGLADSAHIHSRVLLTNCDELPSVLNERHGFFCIRGSDFDRLETDDFRAIEAWLADALFIAPKKQPQPHQTEALNALLPALHQQDRVSAIMACGTGKTLVALWVAEKLRAERILVLLPSLALLRQTLHEWLRETNLPGFAYLCVCSDPTVKENLDGITTQQSDLDFRVSTDAASVRNFLDARFTGVRAVFSTYQSAHVVGAALKPDEAFDLGVFDEAHKTAGSVGRNYAFALEDRNLRIRKRLFLTATPRHYNPLCKDKDGDAQLVFSMDKPEVYGPQAYRLTFAEAARRGTICYYKVIISVISSKQVTNELLNRGEVLVNGDTVRARQVANQLALRDAISKYGAKKVFTFHSTVYDAESFSANGSGGIRTHLPDFAAFHVNGTMPTSLREHLMRDFRACPRGVMSNARCLTEGVNVPSVDMVAFMSPKHSRIDIIQATGRAMRLSPGKKVGYVLVPLYVEYEAHESVAQAVTRAEFNEVWEVLQALQDQDDVLADTISRHRANKACFGGLDGAALFDFVEVQSPQIPIDELRDCISSRCAEIMGTRWDENFGRLQAFKELTGHCSVLDEDHKELAKWAADDRRSKLQFRCYSLGQLARWVILQRRLKSGNKLSAQRVRLLNDLGFAWTSEDARQQREQATWQTMVALYLDYVQELKEMGSRSGKGPENWDDMLTELHTVWSKFNHCDVENQRLRLFKLHRWVEDQRWKFSRGELAADQIKQLKQLGIDFPPVENAVASEATPQKAWEAMFENLVAYKQKYGDCDVPKDFDGIKRLAWWVVCQRNLRAARELKRECIQRLDEVGFVWNTEEHRWRKTFSSCCESLSSGGVSGLEAAIQQDAALNRWVRRQQSANKRRALSRQRQSLLNQVGFPWEFPKKPKKPKESSKPAWEDTFAKLAEFHEAHGHCDMKLVLPVNEHLHIWAQQQRQARQRGIIAFEQIRQLDQLGFIWDTDELLWERKLTMLRAYKAVHGDCNVPRYWQQNLQLAVWVASQRKRRRLGELKPEQVNKLEQIGFAWDAN
jgi:superfamily II DNA or RNA helicase